MMAVDDGLTDIVNFLLEVGADPNIHDWVIMSCLVSASRFSNTMALCISDGWVNNTVVTKPLNFQLFELSSRTFCVVNLYFEQLVTNF